MTVAPKIDPVGSKNTNHHKDFESHEDRWRSFGDALDHIHRRAKARVGRRDVAYIRRLDRFSRGCEVLGRALLMLGPGPVTFTFGVGFLWLYKQIQTTEIGHTVLHGAFNRLEGAEPYRCVDFEWKAPIDEKSWISGHNGKHHGLTNVAGEDPDIDFGHARLTEHTPHRPAHYLQVPATLLTWTVFCTAMNAHFTGLVDLYVRPKDQPLHFVEDRSQASHREAWRKFLGKARSYYAWELVFFPVLAGPRFFRVLLGNVVSEVLRDVYTGATIYCGHVGPDVASFEPGTRPRSRGERYAMQVSAANNFDVPWALSVLCGGLDRQIEHHLFPTLPTNRLREIAPEVRKACEAHGVQYRSDSWPRTLRRAFRHLWKLSFPLPSERAATAPTADVTTA